MKQFISGSNNIGNILNINDDKACDDKAYKLHK